MRAFIVRPFGTKEGIDFDEVDEKLISKALDATDISGRTTGEILEQGNIRTDMFYRLVTANLVIADLSIHNANVFYELGLRHAFQDRHTLLIKSSGTDVPFDVQTDRYFFYDRENPENSVAQLRERIEATLRLEAADSPVFQLLPGLKAQDRASFVKVPVPFREEIKLAEAGKHPADLALLVEEVALFGQDWAEAGLRLVGEAQFQIDALDDARGTWEKVRKYDSNDLRSNQRLGTIYQKLGDPAQSELAIERALDSPEASPRDRAELYALLGSNAKTSWIEKWQEAPAEERCEAALVSPFLDQALKAYEDGFSEDLNHYYSGLNALALLTVKVELAAALPEAWSANFPSDKQAKEELAEHRGDLKKLAPAVQLSLEAARRKLDREGKKDPWLDVSDADFACLTSQRSQYVERLYSRARDQLRVFALGAVIRQLKIYQQLGLFAENAKVALKALEGTEPEASAGADGREDEPTRVLIFTGHRVDAGDREEKRFPLKAESRAREMIHAAVAAELEDTEGKVLGYAGGASGSDILFHEICDELDIESHLLLAGPRDEYVKASVQESEGDWVKRFDAIHEGLKERTRFLSPDLEVPRWLRSESYSIWERNNLWELLNAMTHGAARTTLIALWDQRDEGDGPGGTRDMVQRAKDRGARTVILDARELLPA